MKKSYVITGASSYLGKALAAFYCKNGNKVVLTSQRPCADLVKFQNIDTRYLPYLNLVEENCLDSLRDEISEFLMDGFHVINCVGYFPDYKTIEDMDLSDAKRVLESNVLSVFGVANRLLPLMRERGGGHFIGFSMHTAYQHYPYMAVFSAAKIALESLIKGIANEYLEHGVIANAISLATLLTDTERRIKPYGDYPHWLKTEEVCEIVNNLIEHSGNLVNGSVIHAYKYSETFFGDSYFHRIRK